MKRSTILRPDHAPASPLYPLSPGHRFSPLRPLAHLYHLPLSVMAIGPFHKSSYIS